MNDFWDVGLRTSEHYGQYCYLFSFCTLSVRPPTLSPLIIKKKYSFPINLVVTHKNVSKTEESL